jgi:hypothetical protein
LDGVKNSVAGPSLGIISGNMKEVRRIG